MSRTRFSALAAMVVVLLLSPPLHPCAPAPPAGTFVYIQEESAIIVWNSATRTEHFIRRASFRSDAPDFGFLVPTPSAPELAEVSNDAFNILGTVMQPRIIQEEERGIRLTTMVGEFLLARRGVETAAPPQSVRVLELKSVAGYDAAVLEADDADALNRWLQDHGYPASPALQKWFEPYVAMKWKITAFKVQGDKAGAPSTATVRMSFAADRPFFPYREPAVEGGDASQRTLQILMLSETRMEGFLGEGNSWAGRLQWADRIPEVDRTRLLDKLNLQNAGLPATLWLCTFVDPSSPRPGNEDLFFRASTSQIPQVPPPYVIHRDARIPIPLDVFAVLILAAWAVVRLRR